MDGTVIWQRVEGAAIFAVAIAIALMWGLSVPWWAALLIFFAPDLTFVAYLAGPRVGAFAYNLAHLYATGLVLMLASFVLGGPFSLSVGLLLVAHAGFDRALGYGLKTTEGFEHTHLGRIGKATRGGDT